MAGPKKASPAGWELIRKGIITDDPEPANRFLGCEHGIIDAIIPVGSNPPHGAVPQPPPKSKAPSLDEHGQVDLAKLAQSRLASENARR